ncbi:hypothetical protein BASA62_002840 [Batrachochytrium salamandrivorans]|nr:hypothetical protein BASA62_002840 [Batrachochytrium salamandrivorans]
MLHTFNIDVDDKPTLEYISEVTRKSGWLMHRRVANIDASRRARTSRSAGKVPSDIIGETEHTQAQIPPKASKKQRLYLTSKAPTTTESSGKPVHFSRRAPTKRTAKPKQVDAPITKPNTRISLPLSRIPRLTTASTIQYELQPSSKLSPSSRIPISPRMVKAKPQVDLKNSQSSASKQTFPIHGSVGSVLTGDEESICTDISHESNTGNGCHCCCCFVWWNWWILARNSLYAG